MKIFPGISLKVLDEYTIEHEPISSLDLMERAAQAFTNAVVAQWPHTTPVTIFAGPGNNGGDALAVARMLLQIGYQVNTFLFNPKGELSEECQTNKELLEMIDDVDFTEVTTQFTPPPLTKDHLVIDGLFGIGLNKPLAGGFAAVVKYINISKATVVAIDMPSGLMTEDNTFNNRTTIVHADYTFSMQLPKLAFLFAENYDFVGEWKLLDIGLSQEGIDEEDTDCYLLEEKDIKPLIKPRKKFAHKGIFGHAALIAGAYGMAGSAILAAKACLRSGVGLLTVHTPALNNNILQTAVPEAIVEADINEYFFTSPIDADDYQAICIGPGLKQNNETEFALLEQINNCQTPMVIDADALNILGKHRQALTSIPKGSILTPHPKELERITGKCHNSFERMSKACELAHNFKVYIVLKGAYTAIITPHGKIFFNPTGNPGMATAGSGDVLSGIILSLLAQGYTPEEAAKTGVYVHGMAGDLAKEQLGMMGMKAGDIISALPTAWQHLSSQ
ncbi:MAG: NAD(P)H-hydrate dehydratase [Bacteroides sp.]|nr:NAD(P)H-hydrate dehydratase [Bacteroides sp.]